VLQEREVLRVGSNRPRPIDVRFIAATNRDLEAECRAGRFREDLLFRLNAVTLVVPPLGARATEIEPLANLFLVEACRQIERTKAPAFSSAALDVMRAYGWPGNVRELRNVVERATALCPGDTIDPEHLPTTLVARARSGGAAIASTGSLQSDIDALERSRIIDALARHGGSQSRAAKSLGISRGTLIDRLERFGIPRPRKREVETDA
jgi:DNA-binding NtrC family response regulator